MVDSCVLQKLERMLILLFPVSIVPELKWLDFKVNWSHITLGKTSILA